MSFFCSICFADNCFVPSFTLGLGFVISHFTMSFTKGYPSTWLGTSFTMTVVIHFLMGFLYQEAGKKAFIATRKECAAKVYMEKVFDMIPEGILLYDHNTGEIK